MPAVIVPRALAGIALLVLVASCAVEHKASYYAASPSGRAPAFNQAKTPIASPASSPDRQSIGGGPDGGQVCSLALVPSRPVTVFASFCKGGAFKTTDGGANWTPADHGLPERSLCALAADPGDADVVYAHCLDELFKTINAGTTWVRLTTDFTYWSVAVVAPSDSRVLYAFPPAGVFKSGDGGGRWTAVAASGLPDEQVSTAGVDPANSTLVYVGTEVGIFTSRDGGSTWTSANRGLPANAHVETLTIDSSTRDTIYAGTWSDGMFRSTNGGELWTSINDGLSDEPIRSVRPGGATRDVLYAQARDRIFRSTDAGDHWFSISDGLPSGVSGGFVADPASSSTLYAGTNAGVFRTADGGAHWTSASRGVARMSVGGLAIHAGSPLMLFAEGDAGIFSSADAGNTWRHVDGQASFAAAGLLSIESDRSGGIIAHTTSGYFESVPTHTGWTPFLPRQASPDIKLLWFAPLDRAVMYAATAGGLLTTADGGRRWSAAGLLDGRVPSQLAIAPGRSEVAYASTLVLGERTVVWQSVNRGRTWKAVDTCTEFMFSVSCIPVFDPNDVNTVYVVVQGVGIEGGGDLIRKTVDGGVTWSELKLPALALSLTVLPTTPTTLFAQVYDLSGDSRYVLLKSTDAGDTWIGSGAGLPGDFEISRIVAEPTNLRHLFAGTVGRGVFRSLDGGATWEPTGSRR